MFRRVIVRSDKPRGKKAQSSLELAVSLVCVFVLFLGILKVFVWINSRMVMRQQAYDNSRAGANTTAVDESNYPKLDIFGQTPPYYSP